MPITSSPFGKKQDGKEVTLYTLSSSALEVGIIDYGAIITTIKCPDKNGEVDDIVAGFTDVSGTANDKLCSCITTENSLVFYWFS